MEHNIWVVVFAGVLWLVQALKKKTAQPRGTEPGADEAERTRRVQAEVQRKIAERRAGRAPAPAAPARYDGPLPSPVAAPRPVYGGLSRREREFEPPTIVIEESPPAEAAAETAALARQQQLAEQLRALNEANRAAQTRQSAAITASVAPAAETPADGWLAELRQPQGVRRAILLREILGPPVCFR
jgi:hypothetical protein